MEIPSNSRPAVQSDFIYSSRQAALAALHGNPNHWVIWQEDPNDPWALKVGIPNTQGGIIISRWALVPTADQSALVLYPNSRHLQDFFAARRNGVRTDDQRFARLKQAALPTICETIRTWATAEVKTGPQGSFGDIRIEELSLSIGQHDRVARRQHFPIDATTLLRVPNVQPQEDMKAKDTVAHVVAGKELATAISSLMPVFATMERYSNLFLLSWFQELQKALATVQDKFGKGEKSVSSVNTLTFETRVIQQDRQSSPLAPAGTGAQSTAAPSTEVNHGSTFFSHRPPSPGATESQPAPATPTSTGLRN